MKKKLYKTTKKANKWEIMEKNCSELNFQQSCHSYYFLYLPQLLLFSHNTLFSQICEFFQLILCPAEKNYAKIWKIYYYIMKVARITVIQLSFCLNLFCFLTSIGFNFGLKIFGQLLSETGYTRLIVDRLIRWESSSENRNHLFHLSHW